MCLVTVVAFCTIKVWDDKRCHLQHVIGQNRSTAHFIIRVICTLCTCIDIIASPSASKSTAFGESGVWCSGVISNNIHATKAMALVLSLWCLWHVNKLCWEPAWQCICRYTEYTTSAYRSLCSSPRPVQWKRKSLNRIQQQWIPRRQLSSLLGPLWWLRFSSESNQKWSDKHQYCLIVVPFQKSQDTQKSSMYYSDEGDAVFSSWWYAWM